MIMLSLHRRSQAIKWLISLKRERLPSGPELQEWEEWIADAERRAEFDDVVNLWERSGGVGPLPVPDAAELAADDYDGSQPISEWLAEHSEAAVGIDAETIGAAQPDQASSVASEPNDSSWRRRKLAVAAAASVAMLAWIFYSQVWAPSPAEPTIYETGIAQHRTLRLEDGSELLLGARTTLWVTFTRHGRNVVLERGEALFDVARDPGRPFVVHAGKGTITAIGTSFAVQRGRETVEVTVAEGVVRVEPRLLDGRRNSQETRPVVATVTRDQQVSYGEASGGPISIVRVDAAMATAWREGRLQYIDEPLAEVVADVNRYSERQIVLNGAQAGALRFTGVIFQDKATQWSDQLIDIYPNLEIVDSTSEHLVLRARLPESQR